MTAADQPDALYGGWRKSYTMGIGGLNGPQTVVVCIAFGTVLTPLIFGSMESLVLTVPCALLMVVLAVWQRHGMPVLNYVAARVKWQLSAWRGETSYRSLFTPAPQCLDLPGMAAATKLVRAERNGTDPVGLVWNQRTGTMSPTLLLQPAGALLAAGSTVQASVAAWADTLAGMADEDAIKVASVTLQVTPSSGQALTDHVRRRVDPTTPEVARKTLRELVQQSPRASAQLTAWMTLVVDPSTAAIRPKTPGDAAAETLRVLDGVDLAGTGADVLRVASDRDIKRLVMGAFTPEEADAPDSHVDDLVWHEVGPVAAEDEFTTYQHDASLSVSWVLRAAPRREVPYDVLLRLLSPGQYLRRVTLSYRVLSTEEGAAVVERQVNAVDARAEYRRRTQRTATRREQLDAANATRSAVEEARGSAMTQWSIYVTTTVADPEMLPAARREVEKAARASGGIRLREAYGGQAAAMLAGLPLGINPLL